MPIALLLLGLFGLGAVVAAGKKSAAPTPLPPAPPGSPAPGQYTPPGTPTAAELQYFDIRADGVRVFKAQYLPQILSYLAGWGFGYPVANDQTVIQLVQRRSMQDATAAQWLATYAATRVILAVRWMAVPDSQLTPGTIRTMRAVGPGEESNWAGPQGVMAVLAMPSPGGSIPGIPGVPGMQTPGAPSQTPQAPQAPTDDPFGGLKEEIAAELRSAMTEETNPDKLVLMADSLEGASPHDVAARKAAKALRARAKQLRTAQELEAIQDGRIHIIRKTSTGTPELGTYVALHYTGNANKWRELPSVNPGMRALKRTNDDGSSFEYLSPWEIGQKVTLPPAANGWDTSRGLPPAR